MARVSIDMKTGSVSQDKQEVYVGIDLGTTHSLVAAMINGKPEILSSQEQGTKMVPSIVHFDEEGAIQVGERAKEKLAISPDRTIYSAKRLLGKSYTDLEEHNEALHYTIIETEDEDALVKVRVDDRYYSPIEIQAEILKALKMTASQILDQEVVKTVITVPAYFNDAQRQATRQAGKLAGLDVLRIVNEPTAAALAYGLGTQEEKNETVAVYDLGGGTFDVSILQIHDGIFEVLATKGDTFLGGDDFDRKVVEHWLQEIPKLKEEIERNPEAQQSLRLAAEQAKKQLSEKSQFSEEFQGHLLMLSREKFESLIQPIVDKTLELFNNAIQDSGLDQNQIDKIILVGGSTKTPFISQKLKDRFHLPIFDEINPDEVVALGAAIQADILAGNTKNILLLDVTPLSMGIETVGGLMDVIIPRNTKIPTGAGRQYTTSVDGQTKLRISVYQGERDMVSDNRKLGEFILNNIPPMPAGLPKIEIQFIIDADGILIVRARELRSGVEQEIEIQSQYGISEEEMATMLMDSIKNAESDMNVRALTESRVEAEQLIRASKLFLKQNDSWLSEQQKREFDRHMEVIQNQIRQGTKDDIQKAIEDLNSFSGPLAHEAMDRNIGNALQGKTTDNAIEG